MIFYFHFYYRDNFGFLSLYWGIIWEYIINLSNFIVHLYESRNSYILEQLSKVYKINGWMASVGILRQEFPHWYWILIKFEIIHWIHANNLPWICPQTMLHYHINEVVPLSSLFNALEALRRDYPTVIEDYSVSETTLEEVFLSYAQEKPPQPVNQ